MRPYDPDDRFATPPAPVYMDEEAFAPMPEPRLTRPRPPRTSRARRATFGLAVITAFWLLALAAAQATSSTVAIPFLERTVGALGDVPALLQVHEAQIRTLASQGGDAAIPVPGLPVQGVTLPRPLAQTGTREVWAAHLLHASAEATYERGAAAFTPGGGETSSGTFSTSAWVRVVLALMSSNTHALASLVALGLGGATLAMAALAVLSTNGARRFVAIGLGLAGGAIFAAAVGVIGMGVAIVLNTGSDSAFVNEVGGLIRAISWTPLYDARWIGLAGLAIIVPAAVLAAWFGRSEHLEAFEDD